jgi:SAM-dependent methyltransferase
MLPRSVRATPGKAWKNAKALAKSLLRRVPGIKRLVFLADRMAILEQSLAVLRASLQSKLLLQENRIRALAELRPALGQPPARAANGLSAAGLEFLMAHARLPAPPGPILDPGRILEHGGVDFSSLGYQIHHDRRTVGRDHAWSAILCRVAPLSNDANERLVADALQALRPGGRLILSLPLSDGETPPAWLERLAPREVVRAHRDDAVWTFAPAGAHRPRGESLIVGVVEKP